MYAVPESLNCHVKKVRLLLSKSNQHATNLFNACVKDALISPSSCDTWYSAKPLQKQSFSGFMRDICKSAECQNSYTPHFLRATAISSMNDAGSQARHIMFMSGHRFQASMKTYNRNISVDQKRKASSGLATISNPNHDNTNKLDTLYMYNISLPLCDFAEIPLHALLTIADNATSSSPRTNGYLNTV